MLIKLVGVYPVRKRISVQLMDLLDIIRIQEDMKDIQAMAQRYHTLLQKCEFTLSEESSSNKRQASIKATRKPAELHAVR